MAKKPLPSIAAEIVTSDMACTLEELCLSCSVEADWIVALVEYGVIEPVGKQRTEWMFAKLAVVRVAKAKRLERDLGLNTPGVALALDLLDEIEELRTQLASHRLG
jgi:chaperone modulatory protein CbpM